MYCSNIELKNRKYLDYTSEHIKQFIKIYCPIQYFLDNSTNKKYIYNKLTNKKKTLLYVINFKYYLFKMSRIRIWIIKSFYKLHNISLFITGLHWYNYNNSKTLLENINSMGITPDYIIWYKPLEYDCSGIHCCKCIIYNEMWDVSYTTNEILKSNSNIIICHHLKDYDFYKGHLKQYSNIKCLYIPHHSNPRIFYNMNYTRHIDILISGITTDQHYPLKSRLVTIIQKYKNSILKNYTIYHHIHPGYQDTIAFDDNNQKTYNKLINQSKICICCSSKYKYRLAKYIEIPMSGGIICGDIPYKDNETFSKFIIEVNMNMSDLQIAQLLHNHLSNQALLKKKQTLGETWAKQYTLDKYATLFYNNIL